MANPTVSTRPALWHFPISHFNEKVRWALDYKRIPHLRQAQGLGYMVKTLWATGTMKLPILFLDGKAIGDSTRIIEALERYQPDPSLYPSEERERRRALALEDYFDEEVGHAVRAAILGPLFESDPDEALRALLTGMPAGAAVRRTARAIFPAFRAFYELRHDMKPARVATAPAKVRSGLDRIEKELQPSGYLVGDRFTVADLTAAALFCPLVMPAEFQYRPAEPHPKSARAFRELLADHVGFKWVLEMYRRHRGRSAEVPR